MIWIILLGTAKVKSGKTGYVSKEQVKSAKNR